MNRMTGDKPQRDWDEVARLAFGPVVVLVLALLIGIIAASEARAHHAESGWLYPGLCCTPHRDCKQLEKIDVITTNEGYYVIPADETVPYAMANSSPDGEYHYCDRNVNGKASIRKITPRNGVMNRSNICFWAPEIGF